MKGNTTMWGFGNISNDSQQILMFDYAVPVGTKAAGSELNATRGDAILEIGSLGAIYFTDLGQQPGGAYPWAVQVLWGTNIQNWYYDGNAAIDVQVNADGSFTLSGEGQQITGSPSDVPPPDELFAAVAQQENAS
jgi:hypothetical protein